jgi:UDP-glucose:(heptosyl)LPS alpha-1,3-glucosyltransferase
VKLAFCLFKYFPFGGLQRDFMRIAKKCFEHGHEIAVYCMEWQGEQPEFLNITVIPKLAFTNHKNALNFSKVVRHMLQQSPVDLVIGFDKMPSLDLYYCADSCYVAKVSEQKAPYIKKLYNLTSRYKAFEYLEDAVFNNKHHTKILFISGKEQQHYQHIYATDKSRCFLLPPHIDKTRFNPLSDPFLKQQLKTSLAKLLQLDPNEPWLLMVGSGFRTKGVDRSIKLLKSLIKNNLSANLIVIGQDKQDKFLQLAKKLGIDNKVRFLLGRDDIADFMSVATLLLHPAYRENTGTVILESIIMGLPVVASGICGYSEYIKQSGCGEVVAEPFSQTEFEQKVLDILINNKNILYAHNGLIFRDNADIYNADNQIISIIEGEFHV